MHLFLYCVMKIYDIFFRTFTTQGDNAFVIMFIVCLFLNLKFSGSCFLFGWGGKYGHIVNM